MLNLLIALMGDIFDKIQENAKAEFMLARAEIVLEFETKLSESNRKDWMFPKWLQILAPEVETKRTNWEGKVRDLKENVNEVQKKLEDSERKRANSEKERKRRRKVVNKPSNAWGNKSIYWSQWWKAFLKKKESRIALVIR